MKFRFRLEPMIKIADRKRKALKSDLSTVVSRRQTVEEMIEEHKAASLREDQTLVHAASPQEALLFFQRRQGRQNELDLLLERLQEFQDLEKTLEEELIKINYELHRLEKAKEKARAKFRLELQKSEDRELDEIATLRFKPGS